MNTAPLFEIIKASAQMGIFNFGHQGRAHLGFTESGYSDEHAACWANWLVGNPINSFVLELLFGGASFQCLQNTQIAITGANCIIKINGIAVNNWQTLHVKKNDQIDFGYATSGLRIYIAVMGGIIPNDANPSFTENPKYSMPANSLITGNKTTSMVPNKSTPRRFIPNYTAPIQVNVFQGVHYSLFSKDCTDSFFSKTYRLSTKMSRMGIRLNETVTDAPNTSLTSSGVAFGSIQVPSNGKPIILMKEHQTMGGYPVIAQVARLSLSRLAQAKPNQPCQFILASRNDELKKLQRFIAFFNA